MSIKNLWTMITRFEKIGKLGIQTEREVKFTILVVVVAIKTAIAEQSQASNFGGNTERAVS